MGRLSKYKAAIDKVNTQLKTEYEKAHSIAQRNASLPVEQGGLGLPADNTAMDRARAMGFDKDVYHGSYSDITNIDPEKFSNRVDYMKGFFTADNPEIAGNYGDVVYPLKQARGIQVSDRRTARREGREVPDLDTVFDTGRGVNVTNNPSNIRSVNAAFDPLKRNSSNILASAGAGAAVAGGSLYTPEENQAQAGVVDKVGKKLYRGLEKPFDKNYNLSSTDAPQGYSTWTDNPELARQYAGDNGFIYEIELPKSREGLELIDSEGERALFVNNQKKAGLNNISGDEYLVYQGHDEFSPNMVNQYLQSNQKGATTPQGVGTLATQTGVSTAKSVSELAERLKGMEGVKTLNLYETNNGDLKLDTLIIDKDKRNKGIGSNVMNEINSFADESGKRVVLTPAVKDDFQGTTSRSRLVKYYKGHGFQENKGRKKDYSISEGMIRDPQKGSATPQSMGTLAALSGGTAAIYNAAKNDKLGEAANYAQDAANMIGYIPSGGLLTTSDIIGGVAKAGAAATGNLDAYNENLAPYVESAGETKSGLGKAVEGVIGYGMDKVTPYAAEAAAPIVSNVQGQWQRIEDTPGDANLFGFAQELNRKLDTKLFQSQAQIDAYMNKRKQRKAPKQ